MAMTQAENEQQLQPDARLVEKRALILSGVALVVLLGVSIPLFLSTPVWIDVMFYDLCARTLMKGGTYYRDILDTNLFGMAWLHVGIRSVLGWSSEAIRAVDLILVTAIVALLTSWLRPIGTPRSSRMWLAVVLFACYFSMSEWSHCQRDVWMLLPALGASWLRRRHVEAPASSVGRSLFLGVTEGLCWALAIAIKPMMVVPAFTCWLASVYLISSASGFRFRDVSLDLSRLVLGACPVAAIAVFWLWWSGTGPYFWQIMRQWNPEYMAFGLRWSFKWQQWKAWAANNMPWPLVHMLALPLCVTALVRYLRRRTICGSARGDISCLLLVALYLGWAVQVYFFQHPHDYVQVPLLLLAIAVCATFVNIPLPGNRQARWLCVVFVAAAAVLHPMFRPGRIALWPRCFSSANRMELRDRLALATDQWGGTGKVEWQELKRIETYLRGQHVGDGEVTCFHDCTFPLYLEMNLAPSTRYVFFHPAIAVYVSHHEEVQADLAHSPQRFVVADLFATMERSDWEAENDGDVHALPNGFPDQWRGVFPWCEPVVFRAGRYVVHRVTQPATRFWRE